MNKFLISGIVLCALICNNDVTVAMMKPDSFDKDVCNADEAAALVRVAKYQGSTGVVARKKKIAEMAFFNQTGIESVDLLGTVEIGKNAFSWVFSLKTIEWSDSLKIIGDAAFNRTAVESIAFPKELRVIGYRAFLNCKNLIEVKIPNSVTSIGNEAFYECNENCKFIVNSPAVAKLLKEHGAIPESCEIKIDEKGQYLFSPDADGRLVIPDRIKQIDDYMFKNRKDITSIVLHDGITAIGKHAFDVSYIPEELVWKLFKGYIVNKKCFKSITIPGSIISIGEHAFEPTREIHHNGLFITIWGVVNVKYNGGIINEEKDRICELIRNSGFKGVINLVNSNMEILDTIRGIDTLKVSDDNIYNLPSNLDFASYNTVTVHCRNDKLSDSSQKKMIDMLRKKGFIGTVSFCTRNGGEISNYNIE